MPAATLISHLPTLDPALSMRLSAFEREAEAHDPELGREAAAGTTQLAALPPTLMRDLLRFGPGCAPGQGLDLLEVLAGALRHGRSLRVHLGPHPLDPARHQARVLLLTVLPRQHRISGPVSLAPLTGERLARFHVLRVQPAQEQDEAGGRAGEHSQPLSPLAWQLALHGERRRLLPEIAGTAAYRVTPGADLAGLDLPGAQQQAVVQLRERMTPLAELARWPGLDAESASRLLNALYLQSALMVSRSHPGAIET